MAIILCGVNMTICPVRVLPDPVLLQKSKRVRVIDGSIKKLIGDMLETMHYLHAAGLAAPQVGVPLRVIVVGIPEGEDIVLINPEVVRRKGERLVDEGCLSIPDYRGEIMRAESVTVKGRDQNGKEIRIKADGRLAQALEHEIDHLKGILYIDHPETKIYKIEPEEAQL